MTRTTTRLATSLALLCTLSIPSASAQQPTVVIDGDDITIRGCVGRAPSSGGAAPAALVWTRKDIMLQNAMSVDGAHTTPLAERVFYWIEDEEDLARHVGQLIEVEGDLGDFEKGEIEVERDGEFTDIELKLDGATEKARVPSAWLGPQSTKDGDIAIVSRKIDVDRVKVIGPCPSR